MSEEKKTDFTGEICIGQWATYFDTGLWTMKDGQLIAPPDLTLAQLKDFLLATGGGVYLGKDGLFRWVPFADPPPDA
jgi:hypothetical protein